MRLQLLRRILAHYSVYIHSLPKTRWSAKLKAVKGVYMHLREIIDALEDLTNRPGINVETKSEASCFSCE